MSEPTQAALLAAQAEARRGLGNGPEWLPQFAGEVLSNVLRSINEALGEVVCEHGFGAGHLVYKRNGARLRDWCDGPAGRSDLPWPYDLLGCECDEDPCVCGRQAAPSSLEAGEPS